MKFKLKNNRKGSEKTIEIFVALFLILAVAMVLLKMFSGQVADKTNELNRLSEQQSSNQKCVDLCSQAKANNCRVEDQIAFCATKYEFDLNGDNQLGVMDKVVYKLCEDSIFCPITNKCVCGSDLSLENCIKITKKYYRDRNINTSILFAKYNYTRGVAENCDPNDVMSWRYLYNDSFY